MKSFTIIASAARKALNVVLPVAMGGAILWWMYRDFDFSRISDTLRHGTNWWWMVFSLVFGITAQLFRGLRWRQTLAPLGEHPRSSTCVHAIFLSYAASLIVPRIGEVTRCGILTRYEGTSFARSIGTVVTERIVDSLLLLCIAVTVILTQTSLFASFFARTGTNIDVWAHHFTTTGIIVTLICLCVTVMFLVCAFRRFAFMAHLKAIGNDVRTGCLSLRDVSNKWLFAAYTFGIWGSYFLHFYITFFCFDFTQTLSVNVALVAFIVGSIAVIVPTPNGLGPWHFAVKTILVLFGVAAVPAETYVLIVHSVQTALIPLLGVYSLIALGFRKRANPVAERQKSEAR